MRAISLTFALVACSGGSHQVAIGPPPAKNTTGTFHSPLCMAGDGHCNCRDRNAPGDGGAGVPDDPMYKRYEIRMTSSQQLWAQVHGASMYKSPERAEECWYVDLPTGVQDVELRASNPDGVSAQWEINELGAQTKSWYTSMTFSCGQPGVCAFDDLDGVKADYAAKRVRDACGSTKVKGITWDTGKAPDQLHPSELAVHVHLEVYKRVPDKEHGDPTCGKRGAGAPADPAP